MRTRLLAVGACVSVAVPLAVVAQASGAGAAGSTVRITTQLHSLGQGVSQRLADVPAQPVAAGRNGNFPYRPVPHRRVPGALATDPGSVQTSTSTTTTPSSGTGFAGSTNTDSVLPPDTNGDIGYDGSGNAWYVQWVNLHYTFYERPKGSSTWSVYGSAPGNRVFANLQNLCSSTNDGDPIVVFDRLAQRWVLTQFAFNTTIFGTPVAPYGQCVAVSQTSNPVGTYNLYSWDVGSFNGTDYFPDYPKLGVWPDGYYLTFNYFSGNNLSTFNGAGFVILDRNAMLQGKSAQANASGPLGASFDGMLPVTVDQNTPPPNLADGSPAPESLTALDSTNTAGGSALQWWHVSKVTWGATMGATLTRLADVPVDTYSWDLCNESRNCIPQPGTSAGLDTLSDRLMYRAGYRVVNGVEHVVLNHTVNVATSGTHAAVRWYDVVDASTSPTIAQQSTYAPDADNRWMGSAAMDSAGDIAIGYSVSSASTYPSIRYAGRAATDPLNTLGPEGSLKAGSGSQTSSTNRWGDYSSLVVDPVDGCTFWYTNEYYSSTSSYSWRTWIGSFTFPNCTGSAPPPSSTGPTNLTATATSGTADQVDLGWSGVSGATDYLVYRDGVQVGSTGTATTFHDSGLAPATSYSYYVTAVVNGTESSASNTATATTNAFSVSGSAPTKNSVVLSWTSLGTGGYTVWRRKGNKGNFQQVGSTANGVTTYTDTGLTAGTTYSYHVKSVSPAAQTNTISVRTPKR